jgi:protein subunit release factor B
MDKTQSQLIAEQLSHIRSNIQHRLVAIESQIAHASELHEEQNKSINQAITQIRVILNDHEQRIRTNAASAARSNAWQSIISAVTTAIAIAALIKAAGL